MWVYCLDIPVDKLKQLYLSMKPYKWIRYAIGIIAVAQGHLCTRRLSPDPILFLVDYDADELPTESMDLYYHSIDGERYVFY